MPFKNKSNFGELPFENSYSRSYQSRISLVRMKTQENDSQTLFESQENIFQKISAVFSQSSHSTNIGEMEETLLQAMDNGEILNDVKSDDKCSSSDLIRTEVKQTINRFLHSQTSTSPELDKTNFSTEKWGINQSSDEEDVDMDCSQESVSMLEGLYSHNTKNDFPELTETCMNSEFEVISINSEDEVEPVEEKAILKVENATQTNFSHPEVTHPRGKEIEKHANFIKSVVRLKGLLSSKEPIPERKLWDVLHSTMEGTGNCEAVPKETIGYLLRSSDVENVFFETVQALLQNLEHVLREDFLKTATCWKDSVYEMAVMMLSEAVDCEVGVWKMVDSFLCEKIGCLFKDGGKSKNLALEAKTNIIICLCQSTHLSYTATSCIIRKLDKLKTIKLNTGSLKEKISWAYLTKNSYFLLRILESSLNVLKDKITEGKIEDVFVKKPEQKNYNVLEMWKKHWNKNEVIEKNKTEHDWEVVVSRWSKDLDEVLMHCVNYIPVLSMPVQRCGMLAKDILKLCHPELLEDKMEKIGK